VVVYVDDLIMIGGCIKVISSFKRQMQAELKMSDLGPLSFYLDIEVHQDEGKITLSQGAYATRIVEKAGCIHVMKIPAATRNHMRRDRHGHLLWATGRSA
jgi:hypothetical protein